VSAILDRDEALVVPHLIALKPLVWLRKFDLDEDDSKLGNPDIMSDYESDLTSDEQMVKDRFDGEMEKNMPWIWW